MSKQTERDAFRSRWGFILACIGSAVGMGNIWRFPYLVSAWGGMTFLLPYFLFVLLIGSTGIIGEMALDHTLTSRDVINTKITAILDQATDKWGIKVNRVELKNCLLYTSPSPRDA